MGFKFKVLNVVLFQAGWFAAVLFAAAGLPALGFAYSLIWLGGHLLYIARHDSAGAAAEMRLIGAAAVMGALADSTLVLTGVMAFPPHTQFGTPTTLWMVGMWMNFAGTLAHSMGWLRRRYLVGLLMGAVFGPAAYYTGTRLNALEFTDPNALWLIGIEWALCLPLLLWMQTYFMPGKTSGVPSAGAVS